jgi:hypothetical protein
MLAYLRAAEWDSVVSSPTTPDASQVFCDEARVPLKALPPLS